MLLSVFLVSCAARVEPAAERGEVKSGGVKWPEWKPVALTANVAAKDRASFPEVFESGVGHVTSYGAGPEGGETFAVISKREEDTPKGIYALKMQFFPTSMFAGETPMKKVFNELENPNEDELFFFNSGVHRTTFFQCHPTTAKESKGMILYQTSIMFLSTVEARMVKKFQKEGWNVLVAFPSDSFYRYRLPAYTSEKENAEGAARFLAEDMDRFYAEQAYATRAALEYLRKTRPEWVGRKRVLIGTSAGSFSAPAVALKTPGWDALIFVSAGTSLLDAYERGAADVFEGGLEFLATIRDEKPKEVVRIPSDEEYHALYRRASELTKLKPELLAPKLGNERVLVIHGTKDGIIPRDQLEGLHEALGKPERWTYPLGHHLVAMQLLLDVGKIDRWILGE